MKVQEFNELTDFAVYKIKMNESYVSYKETAKADYPSVSNDDLQLCWDIAQQNCSGYMKQIEDAKKYINNHIQGIISVSFLDGIVRVATKNVFCNAKKMLNIAEAIGAKNCEINILAFDKTLVYEFDMIG